MSATLRYDIGSTLADAIREIDFLLLGVFGEKQVERWPGVYRAERGQYWQCTTFAIKLPTEVGNAWQLLHALCKLRDHSGTMVRKGAKVLASKLATSLGVPVDLQPGEESQLMTTICAAPGELSTWVAYADWLQERDSDEMRIRGEMIASWLGKKAAKVKYGVIQSGRDRYSEIRYRSFQWGGWLVEAFGCLKQAAM